MFHDYQNLKWLLTASGKFLARQQFLLLCFSDFIELTLALVEHNKAPVIRQHTVLPVELSLKFQLIFCQWNNGKLIFVLTRGSQGILRSYPWWVYLSLRWDRIFITSVCWSGIVTIDSFVSLVFSPRRINLFNDCSHLLRLYLKVTGCRPVVHLLLSREMSNNSIVLLWVIFGHPRLFWESACIGLSFTFLLGVRLDLRHPPNSLWTISRQVRWHSMIGNSWISVWILEWLLCLILDHDGLRFLSSQVV